MTFPQTNLTLVQRLASGGSDEDWRRFFSDYWGPICRFALRWGARNLEDAEDVASQTFEILWENSLLVRWASSRSSKLRTLLCCVTRNVLSNRNRTEANRDRLLRNWAAELGTLSPADDEQAGAFYAAWAEDVVQRAMEWMAAEYYRANKGDYIRVFYGRLCQRLSVAEVACSLGIRPNDVVNYFRHAKQRLSDRLEEVIREQTARYSPPEEHEAEFSVEWKRLADHLSSSGGLEEAVHRAYELLDPGRTPKNSGQRLNETMERLTAALHRP